MPLFCAAAASQPKLQNHKLLQARPPGGTNSRPIGPPFSACPIHRWRCHGYRGQRGRVQVRCLHRCRLHKPIRRCPIAGILRLIERQLKQPPVYLTHEIPISKAELESLAYTPSHANVLMNLSGPHVRYLDQQLAFMEDGTVLAWGSQRFMEHFVKNWLKHLGNPKSLRVRTKYASKEHCVS